ncbi:uncharacterized protein Z518_10558 [Rhinocladiella mackenziei CBS 650.93]|uniref:Uncharacterized protein n=1 Tax=Rhinocladiella mackenziei CBS 650.93 TaxID=1442369 RepID=A0A0D2I3Q2_9EURO|nr:uncharacterized protein Z518_10558 [Rhinocladiella mackenziei CBS 650.93]KIX00419.1 hypothetical protein Z518_10558 [Rhinocladiella mackenziei CBS 650.93]
MSDETADEKVQGERHRVGIDRSADATLDADILNRSLQDKAGNGGDTSAGCPQVCANTEYSADVDTLLKDQITTPKSQSSYKDLYRYASSIDWLILILSTVSAVAAGAIVPCLPVHRDDFDRQLSQKSL